MISRILDSEETYMEMIQHASFFNNSLSASDVIAKELIRICLSHTQ